MRGAVMTMWMLATTAGVAQAALEGCYDGGTHQCDCDTTENSCQTSGGTWSAACSCMTEADGKMDLPCAWSEPSAGRGGGCESIPTNTTGVTGDIFEVVLSGSLDVWRVMNETKFENCDMSGAEELTPAPIKAKMFRLQINVPGTYLLTSSKPDACANGLKYPIEVTGSSRGENVKSVEWIYAPDHTNPEQDDDWQAFGKGVFHEKAYDDELHVPCLASDGFCLDSQESQGSCYYSGDDFHIGHAVFCDVSEVDCCGYVGCKDGANRGRFSNGTRHGYYFYAPGYTGSDTCCHCFASCNVASAEPTCTYRDVSHSSCQRNEDRNSLDMETIGFLRCALPSGMNINDATIREAVASPTQAVASPSLTPFTDNTVSSSSVASCASSLAMIVVVSLLRW